MLDQAKWIQNGDAPVNKRNPWGGNPFNSKNLPLQNDGGISCFQKKFSCGDQIEKAFVTASALGIFDLFVNGQRVGRKDLLKPGWTDYTHNVFAWTYEITPFLNPGENTVYAEVSCGWWSGSISFGYYGFKQPAFIAQLSVTDETGTHTVETDASWQTSVAGPVMTAGIWDGEYFDARISRGSGVWKNALLFDDFKGQILPPVGPPVQEKPELTRRPASAVVHSGTEDNGTEFGEIKVTDRRVGDNCEAGVVKTGSAVILDMLQNMVGYPRFTVKAKAGTKITVYFAEFLNDSGQRSRGNDGAKGSMYLENYRSATARIVYIANGEGEETYSPQHTFFGFRYLEFEADGDFELVKVDGVVVGSALTETGWIETSDVQVNQLISNTVWGMRSNYLSVPTDCPQRDERLGWTGDTQIFCGAGSYLADIEQFMRKWLLDARASQDGHDGGYCDVIPRVFDKKENDGNAAWGDAGIIVPYQMYLKYGDPQILSEHFDSMEWYMDFLANNTPEGPNEAYGDWLCYEDTERRYISVCCYANVARLMEKCARILGKTDRAEHYAGLYQRLKSEFNAAYVQDNKLTVCSQTAYLLALAYDLLDGEAKSIAVEDLKQKIIDNHYTLSTGFVGTGILCQTLHKVGLQELCYSLLLQTRNPSWLYSVRQGATTVWERWNSYTLETGFGDVNMNSFNHYAYGAVLEWMFAGMAGIRPDENAPGFGHFYLCPVPDMRKTFPEGQKPITSVRARFCSRKGEIESKWEAVDNGFVYTFVIPAGTSATVCLPFDGPKTIRVNQVDFTPDALCAKVCGGTVCFALNPGRYTVQMAE
mgnify:CR=1 FL=1